ncbi:MAG: hypothetical protein HZA84_04105 [Thaumarchaeota archaeon]|nr:hypothetical protein [Nitrososphaerota archaeon]
MNKEKLSFIKMRCMVTILIILCISVIIQFGPLINAVPKYDELEIQKYKVKLEQAINEKISPRKQLEVGIRMFDIVCFNETIPLLKLSENTVACVKPKTAEKLMDRYWGIVKNKELSHGPDFSCGNAWSIKYDNTKPNNSTIIKIMRNEIKKFSELILWQPIIISYSDENILFISLHGSFQADENSSIIKALEKMNSISKVEYLPRVCN